ncbi:MAG TPA: hypothetical protein VIY51_05620 [Xanthobacteraceae bacterium]
MGYDLHITRKNDWSDPKGPKISLAEWLAFVNGDPEMRLEAHAEARLDDGSAVRGVPEGLSIWTEYSQHDEAGNKAWFLYSRGEVTVKNPDEEIIRKMWSVAQALSAKVQGDDGEVYDSCANESHRKEYLPKKAWWKFW